MGITITDYSTFNFNTEAIASTVPAASNFIVSLIKENEIWLTLDYQGHVVQLTLKGTFDPGLIKLLPKTLDDVISSGLSTSIKNYLIQFDSQPAYSMVFSSGISIVSFFNMLKGGSVDSFSPLNGDDTYITNAVAKANNIFLYDGNDTIYQNHLLSEYNDIFYGGKGTDTVVVSDKSSNYDISYSKKGIWNSLDSKNYVEGFFIKDNNKVLNTIQVNQIEKIKFTDKEVDLTPYLESATQGVTFKYFGPFIFDTYYNSNISSAPFFSQMKVTKFTSTEIAASFTIGSYSGSFTIEGLFDTTTFKSMPATIAEISAAANSGSKFYVTNLTLMASSNPMRSETYSKALTIQEITDWVNPKDNNIFETLLSGNDNFVTSSSGADTSNLIIYGYAGNDQFFENQKLLKNSDRFFGGDGTDTLVFSSNYSKFTISSVNSIYDSQTKKNNLSGFIISDHTKSTNSIEINQVEKIQFADTAIDTSMFSKMASLSETQKISLIELYIASFNRAPDSLGLYYWGSRLSDGMSLQDIAKSFFVQKETVASYPSTMSNDDFVRKVYDNVLNRPPDTEGLNYWVGELNRGSVSKDSFLLAIINGAKATTGSAKDRSTLSNKELAGAYFALSKGLNNSSQWSKDVMSGVTDSVSSLTDAYTKTDTYSSLAQDSGTSELVIKIVGVI